MGILSGRRLRFEKPTLFLSDPRADVSERGGPGLPGTGGPEETGEPVRAKARRIRALSPSSPVFAREVAPLAAGPRNSPFRVESLLQPRWSISGTDLINVPSRSFLRAPSSDAVPRAAPSPPPATL